MGYVSHEAFKWLTFPERPKHLDSVSQRFPQYICIYTYIYIYIGTHMYIFYKYISVSVSVYVYNTYVFLFVTQIHSDVWFQEDHRRNTAGKNQGSLQPWSFVHFRPTSWQVIMLSIWFYMSCIPNQPKFASQLASNNRVDLQVICLQMARLDFRFTLSLHLWSQLWRTMGALPQGDAATCQASPEVELLCWTSWTNNTQQIKRTYYPKFPNWFQTLNHIMQL